MSERVLVTGGAGFIGSHLVRALVERGFDVVVLDSLERPGHPDDLARLVDRRATFLRGDVADPTVHARALDGVSTVCHLAARGGYTDDVSGYVAANTLGTARLLEAIRARRGAVRRLLVASSVAVYGEGAATCPAHGRVHPPARALERLEAGRFEPVCPRCGAETTPVATCESDPVRPERPYSITKYDQERLVLSLAPELGVDAAALRYFVTYGPGQSLHNPYTGVLSLFAGRTARGGRPLVYEDGGQTRDFIYISDLVAAHLLLLDGRRLGGRVFNAGTGAATRLVDLGRRVLAAFGRDGEPELAGRFRLGDVRHVVADCSALAALGWRPQVGLDEGIARFVEWFRGQPDPGDRFAAAEEGLARAGLVRPLAR